MLDVMFAFFWDERILIFNSNCYDFKSDIIAKFFQAFDIKTKLFDLVLILGVTTVLTLPRT